MLWISIGHGHVAVYPHLNSRQSRSIAITACIAKLKIITTIMITTCHLKVQKLTSLHENPSMLRPFSVKKLELKMGKVT